MPTEGATEAPTARTRPTLLQLLISGLDVNVVQLLIGGFPPECYAERASELGELRRAGYLVGSHLLW